MFHALLLAVTNLLAAATPPSPVQRFGALFRNVQSPALLPNC